MSSRTGSVVLVSAALVILVGFAMLCNQLPAALAMHGASTQHALSAAATSGATNAQASDDALGESVGYLLPLGLLLSVTALIGLRACGRAKPGDHMRPYRPL